MTLQAFAEKVEAETLQNLRERQLDCEANKLNAKTRVIPGRKYTKIDVGTSGKLMVDASGTIYGIKAYGVIHKGHCYGTLDTVDQYFWGTYSPTRKGTK